jgi:hypothetical protein
MRTRTLRFGGLGWFPGLVLLLAGCGSSISVPAHAQGTRAVIPQGFEFPASMSGVKYHYPRGSIKSAVMTGTWIAENVEGVKPETRIDVATVKLTNEPTVNFSLTNQGKWPLGVYRLEIRSDGQVVHTVRFTVR